MRKILLLLMLTISLSLSATSKDTLNAVTMVSYEQGVYDLEGTLALRNNTNKDIHNVTFRITYLDMKGNPLDYEDYSSEVEIAPGMTKKVNITAYESTREYSYYLSEDVPDYAHKFKIKFELTGYNTPEVTDGDAYYYKAGWISALLVFGFLFVIGLYIGLYALVAVMAKRRHRNAAIWLFLSLFGTPLIAIIVLLCIGDADNSFENEM